jgi:hypothetical protein
MGVLPWCIDLGRIDIIVEVNLLARFQACPREGHLEQMFHLFAYLKQYNQSSLVFDWTEPSLDETMFKEFDWKKYYLAQQRQFQITCLNLMESQC